MEDDEVKPKVEKEVLVLGATDKGLRVAVREGDEVTKLATLTPLREGEAAPVGTSIVRLSKDERGLPHAKMETIYESPYRVERHEGPARVSTEQYRSNYEGINWGKPSKDVN